MDVAEEFRRRARATWAAGDWDGFSRLVEPVGKLVIARVVLESQDRWGEFLQAFTDLIRRFKLASDGPAKIRSDYFVIRIER